MTDLPHTPGPWIAVTFKIPGHVFYEVVAKSGKLTTKGLEGRANSYILAASLELLAVARQTAEGIKHAREATLSGFWSADQTQAFLNGIETSARKAIEKAEHGI